MGDYGNTNCIVLFGHNPRKHSWTPIYNQINAARARGAKVIVLDPRVSDQAEVADLHLRLRAGTDAAMCLGWLKVIFDEKLYDEAFVREWCVGFDEAQGTRRRVSARARGRDHRRRPRTHRAGGPHVRAGRRRDHSVDTDHRHGFVDLGDPPAFDPACGHGQSRRCRRRDPRRLLQALHAGIGARPAPHALR